MAIELADVVRALRDVVEGWEDDPARLAVVQERRRLLGELQRKYGADLTAVIAFGEEAADRLDGLEDAEGEAARLEAERGRGSGADRGRRSGAPCGGGGGAFGARWASASELAMPGAGWR